VCLLCREYVVGQSDSLEAWFASGLGDGSVVGVFGSNEDFHGQIGW
jgi:hypothetical protein